MFLCTVYESTIRGQSAVVGRTFFSKAKIQPKMSRSICNFKGLISPSGSGEMSAIYYAARERSLATHTGSQKGAKLLKMD